MCIHGYFSLLNEDSLISSQIIKYKRTLGMGRTLETELKINKHAFFSIERCYDFEMCSRQPIPAAALQLT